VLTFSNESPEKALSQISTSAKKMQKTNPSGHEPNHELERLIRKLIENNRPGLEQFEAAFNEFLISLRVVAENIRKALQDAHPGLVSILEAIKNMPPAYRASLLQIGQSGWYLDGEMSFSDPIKFAEAMLNDQIEEAETSLEEHFTCRLDGIEASLVTAFPERAKIISAAFAAHRAKQYELSIPVLLAQVDGVCKDLTGFHLFIRKDKKPSTAACVEAADNVFIAALLAPLSENLPISASEKERDANFVLLNRHMVMHGESLDYGTRRNSLKAISLLNYAAQALVKVQKQEG
jgi:hypothetical protein